MVRARIYIFFLLCIYIGCDARGRHLPAPRRVNARVSSPYSIQVKWRDPGVRTRVKDGRRYFLRYTADVGFTNPTASENKTDFEPGEGTLKEKIIRISKRRAKLYGLRPATTYKIDVKVTKGRRSSPWSDVIEVTTLEEEIDESMVQNVTAVAMSSSSVALSWIQPEVADDVMAYTVIVTPTNGRGRQRKVVIANNVTSHVVSSLRPSQSYCFRVQSMKVVGPHPMSRPVIAKPLSARPSGAPHSLKLVPVNSSLVMVSWKPPNQRTRNGQLTGYKIAYKRKRSRKTDVQTVIVGKGQRNYQLGDLESNTTYKVRVAAQNINGTGPFTKWRAVYVKPEEASGNEIKNHTPMANIDLARSNSPIELLPSPPSDIKVINKTGSSLFLSWTVPVTPACCPLVAYRITVQNLNGSSLFLSWTVPVFPACCPLVAYRITVQNLNDSTVRKLMEESHHVHITDLRPNTRFGVSVTALNSVGESGTSEQLLVSTAGFAAPRVTFIHAQAVHLGGHANLTCEAKGQEIPSIEWYTQSALGQVSIVNIRDTNLSISNRVAVASSVKGHNLRRSTLILHEVTQTAEREYTCVARNSVGSDEAKVQLILYEPPQIVRSDGAKVVEGQSARLVCEARGKPLPQIVWVHEKSRRVVEESNSRSATGIYTRSTSDQGALTRVSYLESRRASRKDAGQYLCVATSGQNQVYAHVTLDVQAPRPPAVSKIQTIALSPSRVSVTWLPPLNYSHGIEFYQVSYRKLRETGSVRYKNVTRVGTDLYGLDHDTDYLVGVIASSDSGLGEKGPEVKVTTLTNENLEPVNASVAAVNETMIRVMWDGPAHVSSLYIRGYNIYIRREGEKKVEQRYVRSGEKQQFLFGENFHFQNNCGLSAAN
ncbi:hypothetical protein RRG08_052881 [Elysia crispata]|uniref:Uncharacterized protein n=1 Tax=Elysia crispata TaxID=231223 RepID=A0AAE0ZF19_9GAST|nr:hypothetical protein RRG08_052881 [Elysia crispata]